MAAHSATVVTAATGTTMATGLITMPATGPAVTMVLIPMAADPQMLVMAVIITGLITRTGRL